MSLPFPAYSHTRLYVPAEEVDIPAMLVDLDVMDGNLDRYADFADEHGVRLRSHVVLDGTAMGLRILGCDLDLFANVDVNSR